MGDGEEYTDPAEGLVHMMHGLGAQLGAQLGALMDQERWAYQLVAWDRVNELGAEGWKLLAAHVELTSFVMGRQLGPADAAAALLEQAAAERDLGLPRITGPGQST